MVAIMHIGSDAHGIAVFQAMIKHSMPWRLERTVQKPVTTRAQPTDNEDMTSHDEALLERYIDLFDFAPTGYLSLDRDGTISQTNFLAASLLGVERAVLQGQRLERFVDEPDRPTFNALLRNVWAGNATQCCEVALRQKRQVRIEAALAKEGQECRIAIMDNRQRKITEQQLDERSFFLTESQRIGHIGTWTWEIPNARVIWSDEAHRIFGVSPQSFVATRESFLNLIHPEDRGSMLEWIRACQAGEQPPELEFRIVLPDGRIRLLCGRGEFLPATASAPARMVGTVQDFTERKHAEDALRQSEERFKLSMEATNDGLWDWDIRTDEVYYSPGYFRMLGYDVGVFPGQISAWKNMIHPDDRQRVIQTNMDCVEGRCELFEVEYRMKARGGGWRWILGRGKCVARDEHGRALRLVGTHVDTTERKQVEEALLAAKTAAETATHVKDQFLAKLSHELRTPLTPVLLAVSRWQSQPDLPGALRENLQMVSRNLDLEARLLDDLLDVSRIQHGKLSLRREVFHMHRTIKEALAIVAAPAEIKQIKLIVNLQAGQDRIEGDPARVQQILWNLLHNAIKFTPQGGSITLTTANEPDDQIRVAVTDTGAGIDPELLAQLFEPFEQGGLQINRQYGGLGLGLTICKSLAEAHHGSIMAASQGRGKGATFTLRLPLTQVSDKLEPTTSPPPHAAPHPPRPLRILLVEDHADTARMLSRLLHAEGYVVETAGDVASALASAKNSDFDLLVSDMGLPDGSGLDLMHQLTLAHKTLKAIAVSGYGMEDDIRRSREAGFIEHVVKPISLPQLLATIERVVSSQASPPILWR